MCVGAFEVFIEWQNGGRRCVDKKNPALKSGTGKFNYRSKSLDGLGTHCAARDFRLFAGCFISVDNASLVSLIDSRGVEGHILVGRLRNNIFAQRLETASNRAVTLGALGNAADVFFGRCEISHGCFT